MPVPQAISKDLLGRYIYAYRHIRTNQVIYSLTEQLKLRALTQLPDLGANNKPAEIRGDLWQSLWTLELPRRPEGYQQGLEILQKLREWRVLREHNTKKLAPPSRKVKDEIFQQELDERGGSKKEPIEKLKNRMDRRARVRLIMDQKANSVADLADVLREQAFKGRQHEHKRALGARMRSARVIKAWSRRKTLDDVVKTIGQLLERVKLPQEEFDKVSGGKTKSQVRNLIEELKQEKHDVEDAVKLMSHVDVDAYHKRWEKKIKGKAYVLIPRNAQTELTETEKATNMELWLKSRGIDEAQHKIDQQDQDKKVEFEEFMKRCHQEITPKHAISFTAWLAASDGVQRLLRPHLLEREPRKAFGLSGARILWRDLLDKAHARAWPEEISHDNNKELREKHKSVLIARNTKDLSSDELFWITERPVYAELAHMPAAARQAALVALAKDNDRGPVQEELLRLLGMQPDIQQAVLHKIGEMGLETQEGKLQERRDWLNRLEESVTAEQAGEESQEQELQADEELEQSDALSELAALEGQPTEQRPTV